MRGVGLRREHYGEILERGVRGVDFVEITPENFFEPGGRPWAALLRAREDVPISVHGTSLGIGDVDPIDVSYLASLARVIERVDPFLVSDHFCWVRSGGFYSHDLLPMPFTREALDHVASRVHYVQEKLKRTILLENVSRYLEMPGAEMDEAELMNELCARTECGFLLDVNNVYVTAKNNGGDPHRTIDRIHPSIVREIHIAGFSESGEILIDTHSKHVAKEVWDLHRSALSRFGDVPSLLEWDDDLPTWSELCAEAKHHEAR